MGSKIVYGILIFIALTLINIFARFLYAQTWFGTTSLANEVDPFDIITLIVTSIVTIWLGLYVSKKITEQRYEKEYIISDLKLIEEEINYVERNLQTSSIDLQSLLEILNRLNIYIQRCSKTLDIFKISISVDDLYNQYNLLYAKSTNLGGSSLVLTGVNRNELMQTCNSFIIQTREVISKVNKM